MRIPINFGRNRSLRTDSPQHLQARLIDDSIGLLARWCGRPDLNRHSSFEPRDFHTTSAFAASPGRVRAFGSFVVWTIPSPWRVRALGAARLVSTPSRRLFSRSAWLGIACYRFPRIWAVLLLRFPGGP